MAVTSSAEDMVLDMLEAEEMDDLSDTRWARQTTRRRIEATPKGIGITVCTIEELEERDRLMLDLDNRDIALLEATWSTFKQRLAYNR